MNDQTQTQHSRASIRRWMAANRADHTDTITGELQMTALVEAWDRANGDTGCTLDPDHAAWDVACEFSEY